MVRLSCVFKSFYLICLLLKIIISRKGIIAKAVLLLYMYQLLVMITSYNMLINTLASFSWSFSNLLLEFLHCAC